MKKKVVHECATCTKATMCCSRECAQTLRHIKAPVYRKPYMCGYCGEWFIPKKPDRTAFCSRECSYKHLKHERRKNEHISISTIDIQLKRNLLRQCEICGGYFDNDNQHTKYCYECRDTERVWIHHYKKKCSDVFSRERQCRLCGDKFKKQFRGPNEFCSEEHRAEYNKRQLAAYRRIRNAIREGRLKSQTIETVISENVFARDNYTCHICGKKCSRVQVVPHPRAPTIDHVIPLSHNGEHSYRNVKTAHFLCNSLKGANALDKGEQLLLFG